jgi:hypothetical protein
VFASFGARGIRVRRVRSFHDFYVFKAMKAHVFGGFYDAEVYFVWREQNDCIN